MAGPLLSIIVPVYNAEKYLSAFVDSILAADLPSAELLLLDDGSSDRSYDIALAYAEKYPFLRAERQKNAGPSAVRNRGIDLTCGRYIAFMDSDDYIDPAAFRRTVELLDRYDGELWLSDFHRVTDDGTVLDRVYQIRDTAQPITDPEAMRELLLAPDCVWNVWRCIFSRKFLEENDLRFLEGANCAEDLEFMVRALTAVKKPVFFHNPYYRYRVNYGDSLTRVYTLSRVEQFLSMTLSARGTLARSEADFAPILLNELAREVIFNLAVCSQVPKGERKAALARFREAWPMLDGADSLLARLARLSVRVLGFGGTSRLLYLLKRMKRAVRRIRTGAGRRMK